MEQKMVLLVSADDGTTRRASVALQKAGFDVRRANDADRAAMMLLGGDYAAVVLDRALPNDGSAMVLRRLAANADLFWVPVVLVGSDASLAHGSWARVTKPLRASAVLRALEPVLSTCMV
jgi:DNA-binding response OmpR family regulator